MKPCLMALVTSPGSACQDENIRDFANNTKLTFLYIIDMKVITVRNSSCGKVMFSQACVKNSVHKEGVCMAKGEHAW